MVKKDPRIQTRKIKVSSWTLLGRKSQMEKTIEKMESKGWTVVSNVNLNGKYQHELTFEYHLSDDEYRREQIKGFGCLALIAIVIFVALTNRPSQPTITTPATVTILAIEAATQKAVVQATERQVALFETATATLWTPTFTPTITNTPTATLTPTVTNTPTITYTPSNTFTPTITYTPSKTPIVTPSATITDTPKPSNTPIPRTPTRIPATNAPQQTYYTTGNANVRSCPKTTCDIVTKLPAGSSIPIVGSEEGDKVSGSSVWRKTIISGQEGYIHSSLLSLNAPVPKPVVVPQQQSVPQQSVVSTVPPNPVVSFVPNCSGEVYDCKDLTCSQMAVYWAACPGDPSGLDGSDNDGRYCESKCG